MLNGLLKVAVVFAMLFITLTSCKVSTDNFPKPDELKREIAASIRIPFNTTDTVIYDSFIGICGNSDEDEINRYYEPRLHEQPYGRLMAINYAGTILHTGDSLYALVSRFCGSTVDSPNAWECFSRNKVIMSVSGEAITNRLVRIFENYTYKGLHKWVEKLFVYKNRKWKYTGEIAN
jgi:hypothetical protein